MRLKGFLEVDILSQCHFICILTHTHERQSGIHIIVFCYLMREANLSLLSFQKNYMRRSAVCIDPTITRNKHETCRNAPIFRAAAFLRLFGNKGMIFTATNEYHWCQNLNDIINQGGSQCNTAKPVTGDSGLDPDSNHLPPGPIDGAVEVLEQNEEDTRYYLFKGQSAFLDSLTADCGVRSSI